MRGIAGTELLLAFHRHSFSLMQPRDSFHPALSGVAWFPPAWYFLMFSCKEQSYFKCKAVLRLLNIFSLISVAKIQHQWGDGVISPQGLHSAQVVEKERNSHLLPTPHPCHCVMDAWCNGRTRSSTLCIPIWGCWVLALTKSSYCYSDDP